MSEINVGDMVEFTGYIGADEAGQNPAIKEGEHYEVLAVNEETPEDLSYLLSVPNPKKTGRGSKKPLEIEVFFDECKLALAKPETIDDVTKDPETEAEPTTTGTDDFIEPDNAVVGTDYEVQLKDEDAPIFVGKVTKATKTLLYIGNEKYKKTAIDALFLPQSDDAPVEEVEEQVEEVAEAPKKKAAKKKATTKKKAASKKKAVAKVETPEEPDVASNIVDGEDQDIVALVEDSDDICALAKECLEDSAMMEWRLGGVLHHVRESKAYEALSDSYVGKGGFERYCVNDLGVHYRKARYLINIYVEFTNAGIGANELARIGWTKARNLVKVIDEENAQELLTLAENNTVDSLIDEIKIMEEDADPNATAPAKETVKKMSMKFNYYEDQASFIASSLAQIMEQEGLDTEAEALYSALTRYMTELFGE